MTDQDWDIDVPEEDHQPTGPKALRDAYEKQKQEAQALRQQLDSLSQKVRAQEVSELLSSKGVPKDAFGLFPKDVDVTEDSVNAWVEKYGGLFSPAQRQEAKEEETSTAQEETPQVNAEEFKQIQQVTSSGSPGTPKQDLEAMLANPNLVDEIPFEKFIEVLRSQGAKV